MIQKKIKNVFKTLSIGVLIIFTTILMGCTGSNYYTKVESPSLHLRGITASMGVITVYLTISNPTSLTRHFDIDCNDIMFKNIAVKPRSDKKTHVMLFPKVFTVHNTMEKVTCNLKPHKWK